MNVVDAWDWPVAAVAEEGAGGLINTTWWVRGPAGRPLAVLQRLNTRIFRPEVHEDIEAVATRLAEAGLETPRLLRTRAGDLWDTDADGGVWRCLSVVGDRTVDKLEDPADARSAGELVGRFHAAVRDLVWDFRMVRPGAHDTDAHVAGMWRTLDAHPEHRLHAQVLELAKELTSAWAQWSGPRMLPERIAHGDLKISNVRFEGPRAVALIDLDTLARSTLDVELGDAMRSWCNPLAEDTLDARFDLELFAAAMSGYAAGAAEAPPSDIEWLSIVPGIERICLALACRFARDAIEESYFGFDPAFGGRGEHNLLRARGQARLAADVRDKADAARRALARARKHA